jgi:predicted enzyme related to lactoylglutathione lyase
MTTYTHAKPAGTPTWVDLMTPDADAARAFYNALFGWEYDIGSPEFGGYTTARVGTRSAAGIMGPQPGALAEPAAWSLYFATDDIGADIARAQSLGATLLYPAMDVGGFGGMATLQDPTGAQFSFWKAGSHIGTQIANEHGATAWFELYTPDAKAARDFYAALLGATAEQVPGGLEYYILKHGDNPICAIMQIDPSWGAMPAQWVPYFLVPDTEEALRRAVEHGGKAMSGIDDSPFGRLAALADPGGAFFKIVEGPPME